MSKRDYREYSQEFKLQALELLQRGDKSAGQIERDLGITPGLLGKWKARYQIVRQDNQDPQIGPSDAAAAQAEIRHLQRQLADMTEERDILKKALRIFSRPSE
jgi:transposase